MEIIQLRKIPRSISNFFENIKARIEINHIDKSYNFYGFISVTKFGYEIIPAHQKRIWTPKLLNLFHSDLIHAPPKEIRKKLEEYRTVEGMVIIDDYLTTENIVKNTNKQFAAKYGIALPSEDFVKLLSPIIFDYQMIRAKGIGARARTNTKDLPLPGLRKKWYEEGGDGD